MIRKFAAALFAVSTLSSSVALALGLGEAKVNSTLNQPLNAEIELISVRDLTSAEILPALASREDFVRAGIERPHLLSDLKFNVVFKDANNAVIQLSSQKPIREPFLNFLVEVVWPNGRLLREYSLLIDPPMFASEPAAAVTPAVESSQPAPVVRRDPTPQTLASPSIYGSAVASGDERRTLKTDGSDTLWHIAQANRPSNRVTTQQTMLAIQDLNPHAFIDGNINLLKAGQVLRMPTLDDVEKRSADQAVAQVRAQNRAFAEKQALRGRQIDATGRTASSAPVQQPTTEGVLKIVAADGDAQDNPGQAAGGKAGSATGSGGSDNQLDLALEQLDKANRENRELQSRLQDLEEQLEALQRLVSLKDDQLALLQAQSGLSDQAESPEAPVEAAEVSAESEAGAVEAVQSEEELISAISELAAEEAAGEGAETVEETRVLAEEAVEAGVSEETAVAETEAAQPETAPVQAAPEVTPVSEPAVVPPPSKSFLEQVLTDPLYKGIAGGSVVLLLIILWLASRHNANKEKQFQQELATAGGVPLDDDEAVDLGQSERRDATGAVAAGVGLGAMAAVAGEQEGEEGDVLAEAEAYMAYGRLEHAAQLLEGALENEPGRSDVRLKLMEVYSQAGNREGFDQQFAALETAGDAKALEAAEQLRAAFAGTADSDDSEPELSLDDLENELLSGGTTSYQAATETVEDEADQELMSALEGLETDELLQPQEEVAEASASEPALDDDFLKLDDADVSTGLEEESPAEAPFAEPESDDLDIEFDLSELDLDSLEETSTPAAESAEEVAEASSESSDLELMDFELGELGEASEETAQPEGLGAELVLDSLGSEEASLEQESGFGELSSEFGELSFDEAPLLEESEAPMAEVSAEENLSLEGESFDLGEEALNLEGEEALNLEEDLSLEDVSLDLEGSSEESFDLELAQDGLETENVLGAPELDMSDEEVAELLEAGAESLSDELTETLGDAAAELDDELPVLTDEELEGLESTPETLEQEEEAPVALELDGDLDEEDFDFLAGTDEAATKLDLARAYIDMGDLEGARDILEEVTKEGNEQQQQEAAALLKTLE